MTLQNYEASSSIENVEVREEVFSRDLSTHLFAARWVMKELTSRGVQMPAGCGLLELHQAVDAQQRGRNVTSEQRNIMLSHPFEPIPQDHQR